jgi:hypothetical protein
MPRQKKTAHIAEKLEHKLASLKAIDPNLDLGEDCNLSVLQGAIDQLRDKITTYNDALSIIDSSQSEIVNLEKFLSTLATKFHLGIAFKYGKDSEEYKLIGGVTTRERIRKSVATRHKGKPELAIATQH